MTQFTNQWLDAALDASFKTLVLAALALFLTKLLRIRSCTLKHQLMSGVLLGMLVMPVASLYLPALRLPITPPSTGFREAITGHFAAVPLSSDPQTATRQSLYSGSQLANRDSLSQSSMHSNATSLRESAPALDRLNASAIEEPSRTPAALATHAGSPTTPLSDLRRMGGQVMAYGPPILLSVWLLGSLVMLSRLALGLYASTKVVRRSKLLGFDDLAALGVQNWSATLSHREKEFISIYESSSICVPGTVGLRNVAILLPEEWIHWDNSKLESVLAHEVTHARRRDPATMALAGLNRAIYWFHPVAWWLRRQLADLAETACDDAAIDANGNRTCYARHLLEVAARVSSGNGRWLAEVVPMARQTGVETRIDAILDDARPLSRQLSKRSALVLGTAAVATIALVATVEPDVHANPQEETTSTAGSANSETSTNAATAQDLSNKKKNKQDDETKIFGRVVNKAGQPIGGAEFYAQIAKRWPPTITKDVSAQRFLATDDEGQFAGAVPKSNFPNVPLRNTLIVYRSGFAVHTFSSASNNMPLPIELEEESIISGQILNTEGQPLSAARISVSVISRLKEDNSFEEFLSAWKREQNTAILKTMDATHAAFDMLGTETDREGRFQLNGIPRDAVAQIRVDADHHATTSLYVFNRPGFDADRFASGIERDHFSLVSPIIKSPEFTYICEPELIIGGLVTDEEERPVAGITVYGLTGNNSVQQVKTGEDGRYRLTGLGRGQTTHVSFNVLDKSSQLLSDAANLKPDATQALIELDMVLKQGIVVQGRVTDSLTGEGISGSIRYVPVPSNQYANQPRFDSYKRNRTGATIGPDGSYRIVTIPGPGVLLIQASSGLSAGGSRVVSYRQPSLSKEEQKKMGVTGKGKDRRITLADNSIEFLRLQNAARYVDFDLDSQDNRVDFSLGRGKSIEVQLVDESGKPVHGAFASGVTESWPMTVKLDDPRVTVLGLGEDRPRRVLFLHAERNLAGRILLKGNETSPVTVTMGPAATIRGRALDANGHPLTGLPVFTNYFTEHASELYRFHQLELTKAVTDAEGRFEITHVMPIGRFNLDARLDQTNIRAQAQPEVLKRLNLDATKSVKRLAAPSGGVHDLGDLLFGPPFGKNLPWPKTSNGE